MDTIQIELDPQTLKQAQQVAERHQLTLEKLISEIIQKLAQITVLDDPLWGLFAEESNLIDQMTEELMEARETHPLRNASGLELDNWRQ